MSSAQAAKKLVAACKREMRDAAREVGPADEAAFMRAVSGAVLTSSLDVLARDCVAAGVNPLRALLDGMLATLAVDMQEAGMDPEDVAQGLARQFREAWVESARLDTTMRARAH